MFPAPVHEGTRSLNKLQVAASNLRVDVVTVEIAQALTSASIPFLLLKGRAIATWLYDDPTERPYNDCDLLVSPARFAEATTVLLARGFRKAPQAVESIGPPGHPQEWLRDRDGAVIDLHRQLTGVDLDPEAAFELLAETAEHHDVRGTPVPMLGIPARTLHVAMHVAQHGRLMKKPFDDLQRAIERVPLEVWQETHLLAARLKAVDALGAGLGLLEDGRRLADELGVPAPRSVEVALRAGMSSPVAIGFEWFSQTTGFFAKLRFLRARLVPPADEMRAMSEEDASRAKLARLYVRRVGRLLAGAPRGLREWMSTRRKMDGSG